MKYTAVFSIFDSALVAQGDLVTLKENGLLVHGYRGLDWVESDNKEILEISQNLAAVSKNDDDTFWAEVTLDSESGVVTKTGLYRFDHTQSGCGGYGHAKAVVK